MPVAIHEEIATATEKFASHVSAAVYRVQGNARLNVPVVSVGQGLTGSRVWGLGFRVGLGCFRPLGVTLDVRA